MFHNHKTYDTHTKHFPPMFPKNKRYFPVYVDTFASFEYQFVPVFVRTYVSSSDITYIKFVYIQYNLLTSACVCFCLRVFIEV